MSVFLRHAYTIDMDCLLVYKFPPLVLLPEIFARMPNASGGVGGVLQAPKCLHCGTYSSFTPEMQQWRQVKGEGLCQCEQFILIPDKWG